MRLPGRAVALVIAAFVLACSGDKEPAAEVTPDATSPPAPTTPAGGGPPFELFTDPRPRQPDATVSVGSRPPSPFKPWDRESVVLYDIQAGTEVNFGPGYVVSFSPDSRKFAFNPVDGNTGPRKVLVVDIATKASQEFDLRGGSAVFVDDNHLYMPGSGEVLTLDIRSGTVTPLSQVSDPLLRARLQRRATGGGEISPDGKLRLVNVLYEENGNPCPQRPQPEMERCRAQAFETWKVADVATGATLLQIRALAAKFASAGEIVIATSPQCRAGDGSTKWCEEVAAEARADDPPRAFPNEYVTGTTNIFLVNLATKAAEFVTTTSYNAHTRIWPMNWPLIADSNHVVWTGSFCGQPQGKTGIYDRSSKRLTELDAPLWVQFTPSGDIGADEFGPRAILDIETLRWTTVLPENAIDVVQSPDGRYLAVGGVLGHGGLCG